MIIYKITHKLSGKCYIGQTIQSLKGRWARHCKHNSGCIALKEAIKKYGKDAFTIEEVASYTNMEDLNNAEEYYIDWYNSLSPNGYNLTSGGSNRRASEELRKRLSECKKGNKHNLGKKASEETRLKISLSHVGMLGKKHTKESKEKMSMIAISRNFIDHIKGTK